MCLAYAPFSLDPAYPMAAVPSSMGYGVAVEGGNVERRVREWIVASAWAS